jgi:hypothetical protein
MRRFIGLLLSRLASYLWKLEIAVQAASLTLLQQRRARAGSGKVPFFEFEDSILEIRSIDDVLEAARLDEAVPVLVDVSKVLSGYGNSLSEHNPLVMELQYPGFLEVYFRNFQPINLQEAWFPRFPAKEGEIGNALVFDRRILWLPWIASEGHMPTNDIAGSGYGHGSQFRGPISRINLNREQFRMHSLHERISTEGYRPEKHGHIYGQFLEKNGEWLFVILGGNHRSAVLRGLGCSKIPVLVSHSARGGGIIRFAQMRNPDEEFVFEALFSRYGQTVRREFVERCLQHIIGRNFRT